MSIIVDSDEEKSIKLEEVPKQENITLEDKNFDALEEIIMECEKEHTKNLKKRNYVVYSVPIIIKKRIKVLLTCKRNDCEDDDHKHLNPLKFVENTLANTIFDENDGFGLDCDACYETKQDAIDDKDIDYIF